MIKNLWFAHIRRWCWWQKLGDGNKILFSCHQLLVTNIIYWILMNPYFLDKSLFSSRSEITDPKCPDFEPNLLSFIITNNIYDLDLLRLPILRLKITTLNLSRFSYQVCLGCLLFHLKNRKSDTKNVCNEIRKLIEVNLIILIS